MKRWSNQNRRNDLCPTTDRTLACQAFTGGPSLDVLYSNDEIFQNFLQNKLLPIAQMELLAI